MSNKKKKHNKEQGLAQSIDALTQNGLKAFRMKEYPKAIAAWERIPLPRRPLSMLAEAHFRLGQQLFYGEYQQEGLLHLQAAAQALPDDPIYAYHLGLSLHRQGDLSGAAAAYQTACKTPSPIAARAAYPLALALLQAGQDPSQDAAWKELSPMEQAVLSSAGVFRRRPYRLPPEAPLLWQALVDLDSDNHPQARAQLEQVLADSANSAEKSLAHYYLGVLAARAGDLDSALQAWQAADAAGLRSEALSANLAELHQRRAEEAVTQGQTQSALAAITEAKRHAPAETSLDELLAQVHQQLGYQAAVHSRWQEAKDHWQTAVQLDSGSFRLAYNLALAYEKSGNFFEAAETWREALRRRPRRADHPDALDDDQVARLWQHAAECYTKAGAFEEVGRVYQQAIKWAPENLDLRLALAENALRDGRLQLARNELDRLLERNPKHVAALVRMGEVCSQDSWWNRTQAPKYWQKALEIDPRNPQARQFLAEWYLDQAEEAHHWSRCESSLENYQKSLEFRPDHIPALSGLMGCHLCLSNKAEAETNLQQALASAKTLEDYAQILDTLLTFDQHPRAMEALSTVEARLPNIPIQFYVEMSEPLLKEHKTEQAEFWLQKAIDKAAPADHVLTMIADVTLDTDEEIAYRYAQKATVEEKTGQSYLLLGVLESKRNNASASRKNFREAERIARQTHDEELTYRIESARIYAAGPQALLRRLMDIDDPDMIDEFFDLFGKELS